MAERRRPRAASPRGPDLGRGDWIREAAEVLAAEGADAVRVEPLARRLGVTKGSFYWHFEDRRALLDALVESWRRAGTERIIDDVDAGGGGPADRLRRLWRRTLSDEGFLVELALRDLARRDPAVAEAVEAVDAARLRYVRGLFRQLGLDRLEAEARAMAAYSLLVGNHFIARKHGGLARGRVLAAALELLLDVGSTG